MLPGPARPDALPPQVEAAMARVERARERLAARPAAVAGALAALALAYTAYRLFAPLPAGHWPVLKDSVIFEYVGWYVAEGNRLYVDVWEVKPPLAFEVTALLALLAGDNVVLYHVLNLLANGAAVVVGAAAAAGVVGELTDDPLAAVTAGAVQFALPVYAVRALIGFKSKYFVVAAGLGALYLAYRERPAAAGAAAAVAAGFWQLAVVFPVAVLGYCWQTGGRAAAKRVVGAGAAVTAVTLLPVVLWGTVPAMVAEVVLTPLLIPGGHSLGTRVELIGRVLGWTRPLALLGLAGIAGCLAPARLRRRWPVALVVGWFTVQTVALDFDRAPDLFPWFASVAVGVGLAVAAARRVERTAADRADGPAALAVRPPRGSQLLGTVLLLAAALSVATVGGVGGGAGPLADLDTYDTDAELDPSYGGATTYNATEKQYVYWNRVEIPTCRALGAYTQYQLVKRMGLAEDRPWYDVPCGQFGPTWNAVAAKFGIPLTVDGTAPERRPNGSETTATPTETPRDVPTVDWNESKVRTATANQTAGE